MYTITLYAEMGRVISQASCYTPYGALDLIAKRAFVAQRLEFLYAECRNANNDLVWRLDNHMTLAADRLAVPH